MSVADTSKSPYASVRTLPLEAVRWTNGFWADRFRQCADVMVPAMGRLMSSGEQRVKFIGNFEVACGKAEGRHRGPRWNDGDFFKWLESAAAVYLRTKDPQLDSQMDEFISLIAQAQRDDGYIHTDIQIRQRAGEKVEEFDNPMDFEMYNMGHLIAAAIVHHRATGKDNLLKLALKSAGFLNRIFANPRPEQARHGICPTHLMALIELYRLTGDKSHQDLAVRLLNMRDLVLKGDDDNQDRIPFRKQTTAHGHGVRSTYLYSGATDIYLETGDESLLPALDRIWDDLTSTKLYITGGCGALFDGASPDGSSDQLNITRTHQAFGRPFQLPQSTAHNETCAAIGNLMWNWRMFLRSGEARFIDLVEHTLYNSVLAGISWEGTKFFYTNTLRQLDKMPVDLRWNRHRQQVPGCFCCPPNVLRTIAEASHYAYTQSSQGIHVNLYGGSRVSLHRPSGTAVRIEQQTDYPWDGKVRLTIHPDREEQFKLFLRIPSWCTDATMSVNGKTLDAPAAAGTFAAVDRAWKAGDVVELNLPMPARMVVAHPLVEEARNQVAVVRGPVVYCLESVDLPEGVRLLDVHLPRDAQFKPLELKGELAGITALQTSAIVRDSSTGSALYRDVSTAAVTMISTQLIPYFAWDNRGDHEMTVWIPLA